MEKIAFVFPGQGTYYIGMGKTFYDNYDTARKVFDKGSEILGIDLAELCFEGPDEELLKTENQQPAIHTVEIAMFQTLKEKGIVPDVVAGYSLGEYAALTAAGSFRYEDSVQLVRERGVLMEEAVPNHQGKMVIIYDMPIDELKALVAEVNEETLVEIATVNCPGRVAVAGWNAGVDKVVEIATARGHQSKQMRVSGPFHTSLLNNAAAELRKRINALNYREPAYEYIPNA